MKTVHSIRYYEKRLYKLQNAADAIGYAIDENKAYKAACKALPVPGYDNTGKYCYMFPSLLRDSNLCEFLEVI